MERNNPGSGDSINTEEGVRGKKQVYRTISHGDSSWVTQPSQWEK